MSSIIVSVCCIQVDEGYFVHFFAPTDSPRLSKHIVFVLDYSGSMAGRKLEQLKEAMKKILFDLSNQDYFSIVIFHTNVEVRRFQSQIKCVFIFFSPEKGSTNNSELYI